MGTWFIVLMVTGLIALLAVLVIVFLLKPETFKVKGKVGRIAEFEVEIVKPRDLPKRPIARSPGARNTPT